MNTTSIYTIKPREDTGEVLTINHYPWDENGYRPTASACLTWSKRGIHVSMTAFEQAIIVNETQIGGSVCKDSCIEFFFQPMPDNDPRYINCEINAGGVMHIGVGAGRQNREVLQTLPDNMEITAVIKPGNLWMVRYTLPTELITNWFPDFTLWSGHAMRGNFYICDESLHPHFGCWNPVSAPAPDFHRPECFGRIRIG